MDFIERIDVLSKRIPEIAASLQTEEATKNALIMPFLHTVLGYDVFNPNEVIPEFTADIATKKGEKVDYALVKDGEVQILIECKKYGEKLSIKHAGQLFRYFSVTNSRLAILTNGTEYQFFTDLDAPNKMDEKPFLILDLLNIDEHLVPELKKLTKSSFDVESIVSAAGELKYLNQIKKLLNEQFKEPEEEFIKFFAARAYDGVLTPKVKQQFTEITKKALRQFLSDSINDRLKSAIGSEQVSKVDEETINTQDDDKPKIITTNDEVEGFNIVKAILRQKVDATRIIARDTQSYFGVLLDDNNRKPLCRLHFNAKQKYLGLFDVDKNETRHPIETIDQIFDFSEILLQTTTYYE
ncbi:type I restriction endonuclease [Shewanella metallivivens]|uniref:Type I restriction enzyme HsdR N-terminal domain-containing protein n=1 Tax=Shewanella metallivivens TaxID=2872342 RepID=A0ABT5TQ37_9GAMM|nr:type I restriction endonuclease [Shewanella metallivivens]MDD8060634.1 type I restriction enzyme HsdR N-terminal domain-containing protein [Shewanella metallivivens]